MRTSSLSWSDLNFASFLYNSYLLYLSIIYVRSNISNLFKLLLFNLQILIIFKLLSKVKNGKETDNFKTKALIIIWCKRKFSRALAFIYQWARVRLECRRTGHTEGPSWRSTVFRKKDKQELSWLVENQSWISSEPLQPWTKT